MKRELNKKGFTLIELLGAAIIIGFLLTIVVSATNSLLKKNRIKLYERQLDGIVESAKTWANEHFGSLPEKGQKIEITLDELKRGGYADKDLKNPKNEKPFDDFTTKVIISNDNGILKYDVIVE